MMVMMMMVLLSNECHAFVMFSSQAKMSQEVSFCHSLSFCFFLTLSVFSTFDGSCLFASYLTNQEMKLAVCCCCCLSTLSFRYPRIHPICSRDISNSGLDTSFPQLSSSGTTPPHENHFMMGSHQNPFLSIQSGNQTQTFPIAEQFSQLTVMKLIF